MAVILIFFLFLNAFLVKAEEDKEKKGKRYFSSSSFSFLLTRGNNKDLTFSFDTDQNLNFKKDKFNLKISIIHTNSRSQEKSEIYSSQLKYSRQISSRASLLGLFSFERNKLAGYNYRFIFSFGAGCMLLDLKKLEISSDLSLGWTRENFREERPQNELLEELNQDKISGGVSNIFSYISLIFSTRVMYNISSSSQFLLQDSFFFNLKDSKDWRLNTSSSLSASINRYFALKTSIQLIYDHQPVPGFKSIDFFLLNSLVIKF